MDYESNESTRTASGNTRLPEELSGFRERSATIDKSEKIRPPRRKRRPSYEVAVNPPVTTFVVADSANHANLCPTSGCGAISAEDIMSTNEGRTHCPLRSGSVPPPSSRSSPGFITTPPNYQGDSGPIVPEDGGGSGSGSGGGSSPLNPTPIPRIRRLSNRQKLALGHPMSNPCSGANTPDIVHGSSAIDLNEIGPFGPSLVTQSSSQPHQVKAKQRNSFRVVRSPATPSGSTSRGWNWIWNRHHPHQHSSHRGHSAGNSASKDLTSQPQPQSVTLKHTGSLLGRKRKSRHISCPDISSASDESSRSTSPVTFKVSLTSLFGGQRPLSGTPPSSGTPLSSGSSFRRPLNVGGGSGARVSVTSKTASLSPRPIVTEQLVVDALAAESVAELQAVQYCQITDPYEHFFVEYCDVEYCSDDLLPAAAAASASDYQRSVFLY